MALSAWQNRWRLAWVLGLLLVGVAVSGLAVAESAGLRQSKVSDSGAITRSGQDAVARPAAGTSSQHDADPGHSPLMNPVASESVAGQQAVGEKRTPPKSSSPRSDQVVIQPRSISGQGVDAVPVAAEVPTPGESTVLPPLRALMLTDRSIIIRELQQPVAMPVNDQLYPSHSLAVEITDLAGACYLQVESGVVRLNGRDLEIGQPFLVQPGSVVTWSTDSGIRFSPGTHPGNAPANG